MKLTSYTILLRLIHVDASDEDEAYNAGAESEPKRVVRVPAGRIDDGPRNERANEGGGLLQTT